MFESIEYVCTPDTVGAGAGALQPLAKKYRKYCNTTSLAKFATLFTKKLLACHRCLSFISLQLNGENHLYCIDLFIVCPMISDQPIAILTNYIGSIHIHIRVWHKCLQKHVL